MSPLRINDGKLLIVGGKVAAHVDCCCGLTTCPDETACNAFTDDIDVVISGVSDTVLTFPSTHDCFRSNMNGTWTLPAEWFVWVGDDYCRFFFLITAPSPQEFVALNCTGGDGQWDFSSFTRTELGGSCGHTQNDICGSDSEGYPKAGTYNLFDGTIVISR